MAERQVNVLGCHCDLSSGRILRNSAAIEAGAAAEVAASRKEAKYADIDSRYVFQPIAVETLGVFNSCSSSFKRAWQEDLCRLQRETNFLFQRASVLVQRFNAVA